MLVILTNLLVAAVPMAGECPLDVEGVDTPGVDTLGVVEVPYIMSVTV